MIRTNFAKSAFAKARKAEASEARQRVVLALLCGVDLSAAVKARGSERASLLRRLRRLLERERQRGLARHWAYDLNRHIALKQALDQLLPGRIESRVC